ncbi:MAG: EAL domain-containing protein [Cyanobacteria bacterium J06635_15]
MVHQAGFEVTQFATELQVDPSSYFKREFQLYYQPIISLENQRLHSFEALIWWQPSRAQFYSSNLLDLLKDSTLDVPLHQWILYEACQQLKFWQIYYLANIPLSLSVNLSVRQLNQKQIVEFVEYLIASVKLMPTHLQLEIPAEWALQNWSAAKAIFNRFKRIGISICIDDFDPSYMSYEDLKGLPIKVLKIKQDYIRQLPNNYDFQNAFQEIILVAKSARIQVAARGIEKASELDAIKSLGCTAAQGVFLSELLSARQAAELISWQVKKQPKDLMAYVIVMNILSQFAQCFLGKTVVIRLWKETMPKKPWLALIKPYEDRRLILKSVRLNKLDMTRQQELRQWMYQFIQRCSRIVKNFSQLLIQAERTPAETRLLSVLCPTLFSE